MFETLLKRKPASAIEGTQNQPRQLLDTMEERLAQLPDEIAAAQADLQALAIRKKAADAAAAKFTEQAGAGTLDDPARLVTALRQQSELAADDSASKRLQALQAEHAALEQEIHAHRQVAAREAYLAAVAHYAAACAPLPALAVRVREAAAAAGVTVNSFNSPGLLGREIQVGGAIIAVPSEGGL
jgi:chromosome segregation ATPase